MVTLDALQDQLYRQASLEYVCDRAINLYNAPGRQGLVTQADKGQHLRVLDIEKDRSAIRVRVCKDDYLGWIDAAHTDDLMLIETPYQAPVLTQLEIQQRLPGAIAFAKAAMSADNEYLWGGATAPNYDCSGLVQAAFLSVGVLLPRDSYQQEDFVAHVSQADLQSGDLIFFGTPKRTSHVALYLGDGQYIHSSGKDQGRNGIGLDSITDLSDPISAGYHKLLRCFGRVASSYQPKGAMGQV